MNDYEYFKATVKEVLLEVRAYSPGKIEQIIQESQEIKDTKILESWRRLTLYICYDRYYCGLLGVDYVKLPKKDVDSNMVLPLL